MLNLVLSVFPASYCPGWNVSVFNTSSVSLMVEWGNVTTDPSTQVDYFIALAKEISGSEGKHKIIPSEERSWRIEGLKKFTEYNVTVIAVDVRGIPCKSVGMIRRTDESGEWVMNLLWWFVICVKKIKIKLSWRFVGTPDIVKRVFRSQ